MTEGWGGSWADEKGIISDDAQEQTPQHYISKAMDKAEVTQADWDLLKKLETIPKDEEFDGVSSNALTLVAKHRLAQSDALREAVIEECAKALEADAMKCDCAALEERECGCGAWCEWKSITSARAVEIVRELKDTK